MQIEEEKKIDRKKQNGEKIEKKIKITKQHQPTTK